MAQLSLSARPKTLDELVGQEKLVKRIRRGIKNSGVPKGWLFYGEKGSGKTTIARILALSLQCTHQERFGQPCKICRKQRSQFPIYSLNCARNRKVEDIEKFVEQADYELLGKGKRKVFILDEVQELSRKAQRVLLDQTEADDNSAVWIMTTTEPHSINSALRSRLKVRGLRPFDRDATFALVSKLLKRIGSELDPDPLTESLVEKNITSGRLIAHATEAYVEGDSPDDAAEVDVVTAVSTKAICRAVVKGNWEDARLLVHAVDYMEVRAVRSGVIGYLLAILLDSPDLDERTKAVSDAIKRLAYVSSAEENNQKGALAAELFTLCSVFSEYTH